MYSIHSLWNSVEFVSKLNFVVQITGATFGVLIVLIGFHLADLQNKKSQDRAVTAKQSEAFKRSTAQLPKGEVLVMTFTQDAEVSKYAGQIWNMLIDAGFSVDQHLPFGIGGRSPVGIVLKFLDDKRRPPHVDSLLAGFKSIDVNAELVADPGMHEKAERVVVVVGNKEQ